MSTTQRDRRQTLGRLGERLAAQYIERTLGWQVCLTNWRCPVGEIDIVAKDAETLVVVEVRTRSTSLFGSAKESVDGRKVHRLRRVINYLLSSNVASIPRLEAVRCDVIALDVQGECIIHIEHIRNATE